MASGTTAVEIFGQRSGVTLLSVFERKVIRCGNKVMKSGPDLHASEAETMRFSAENTSIPILGSTNTRWTASPYRVSLWTTLKGIDWTKFAMSFLKIKS